MTRKMKFLILCLFTVFLFWFIPRPITKIGFDNPYAKQPLAGQKISSEELNEFLDLWSRMMHGPLKNSLNQISLSGKGEYPAEIVKWLDAQNWDAGRFFYDEQRLRQLIDCAELKNNLDSNIKMSKRNNASLKPIIDDLRQKMKACPFSEDEMDLIKNNLYKIVEIFEGRAVMAKPVK